MLGRLNILPNSFFAAGRRNQSEHQKVLRGIMERLLSSEFANEAELIRRSELLFEFALPMLKLLRSDPRFKKFITPNLIRRSSGINSRFPARTTCPFGWPTFTSASPATATARQQQPPVESELPAGKVISLALSP